MQALRPAGRLFSRRPRRGAREPWFQDAERFSDEWDQLSFDPQYETLPLEYFFQMIDAVFAKPLPWDVKKPGNAADRSTASSRWLKSIQNFVREGAYINSDEAMYRGLNTGQQLAGEI